MKEPTELRRDIAEMLRSEGPVVDRYLEYAKRYAALAADHADAVVRDLWPKQAAKGYRLIAQLQLQKENPGELARKLEAVARKTTVTHVFACRHSLSVYVFGPDQ